jgi:DNA-binding CsgD family transcriptional regulator
MKLGEKLGGTLNVRTIVGSGFVWAWFDALFMSALFPSPASVSPMPEIATIIAFLTCALISVFIVLRRSRDLERTLSSMQVAIAAGASGFAASLFLLLSGISQWYPLLVIGGILGGVYMSIGLFSWGALYCIRGAKSAALDVSGAFTFAFLFDIPLLFMSANARAVFYALFPIASTALLLQIPQDARTFRPSSLSKGERIEDRTDLGAEAGDQSEKSAGVDFFSQRQHAAQSSMARLRRFVSGHLGLSATVLGGMALVMVSFGYLQHLVSFSSIVNDQIGGNVIQVIRGICAILLFAIAVFAPRFDGLAWRVGLLLMVAGFMLMPFTMNSDYFWVSGAIVIGGYTSFDVMNWTVFSQIAHAQSRRPVLTIVVMRCLVSAGYVIGAVFGLLVLGNDAGANPHVFQLTIAVGYLVVVAIMLFMSDDDIRALYAGDLETSDAAGEGLAAQAQGSLQDERDLQAQPQFDEFDRRLQKVLEGYGLTDREQQIALRLVRGRTQPWIATDLGISENTVGTHMRHIYQKMGVHGRQEFIDKVMIDIRGKAQ